MSTLRELKAKTAGKRQFSGAMLLARRGIRYASAGIMSLATASTVKKVSIANRGATTPATRNHRDPCQLHLNLLTRPSPHQDANDRALMAAGLLRL
jgi:hypothetical protein